MKHPPVIAVEENGDEVFTPMPGGGTHCTLYDCLMTNDVRTLFPAPIVRNKHGFVVCTRCKSTYGRG